MEQRQAGQRGQRAVLVDPGRHVPQRPYWVCDAGCGDWPCVPLRTHLMGEMPAVEVSMVMSGYYADAMRELDLPPAEVHRRIFGWINGPTPPVPSGWHPPGGPW